nr:MAG: RNA-dependent RNA polymerase [Yongjia Tick Virus 2]
MKKTTAIMFDDYNDLWEDEGWGAEGPAPELHQLRFINRTDYTLNSPLIPDDLRNYIAHLNGLEPESHIDTVQWALRDEAIGSLKDRHKFLPVSRIHSWWADYTRQPLESTPLLDEALNSVRADHEDTFPVLRSFLKGWLGKESYPLKIQSCSDTKRYGEKFLVWHRVILMLNSSTEQESKTLAKKTGARYHLGEHGGWFRWRIPLLGKVIIGGGLVILPNVQIILDRNFSLMIKDTYGARFQTLFGLHNRVEDVFLDGEIKQLIELYTAGDQIVRDLGTDAYDTIKLLEPVCNLRYCELARESRPLIPEFPAFRHHVEASIHATPYSAGKATFFRILMTVCSLRMITVFYGSFRHWGHPFIDYLEGLIKLHQQVTMPKEIDTGYAQALASDLAYLVLRKKFAEKKKWFVNHLQIPPNHPFRDHIHHNTWPTPKQVDDFGDHWHELPLTKCFEIPDVIDPSLLYSDKSHSLPRAEVIQFVKSGKKGPIPSLKVLDTLLKTSATNWPEFLQKVNDDGIPRDQLVIGLKGKERELKKNGRFFSLMSWMLREYFVVTEYLIKLHYVPLFSGLTMADDLTTVITKLLDRTQGQGGTSYESICIANHIDYEKWNNHQRQEATAPVFRVMGQFLGYPNLIARTHEFFQQSLIYYNGRPDLMIVSKDSLKSRGQHLVCWEGQAGGLEGLRQKGWSVLSLLVIQRESKIRNTKVKTLAQGDNQVICTQYKLRPSGCAGDLLQNINDVVKNNNIIMSAVKAGTKKLGLIINEDETMQSADYLNYGKIPVFRGKILNLFTKRLSRVLCTTNDQIPTLANVLGTVSTNVLTISHFDPGPLNSFYYYDVLSHFTRRLAEWHSPILGMSLPELFKEEAAIFDTPEYKILCTYLDPSLGGVAGTSLSRFLTRMFPDPVTEGLSFWKLVFENSSDVHVRAAALAAGNPPIGDSRGGSGFEKLMEDPSSLNIPRGLSLSNLLKAEIKKCLLKNVNEIKNQVIANAATYCQREESRLLLFLQSIDPLFPRFLSEFRAATFLGITDGLIGLFQNSKTIRLVFSRRMLRDVNDLVYRSERQSYSGLIQRSKQSGRIWGCSASKADELRRWSWGRDVLGATVPHPLEMFGKACLKEGVCQICEDYQSDDYISTLAPLGLSKAGLEKGPYMAYLGSKTSESTSILQPWEKEVTVPLLKRASKMRNAIHWFVRPDSNLAKSILSILTGLTGESWDTCTEGFKRTGSALHRFTCARISSGGYAAINPARLNWLITTTDTLLCIGSDNFDFMFQPSIIFAQVSVAEGFSESSSSIHVHHHLACKHCLRKIEEPKLESPFVYSHPDVSHILKSWKPEHTSWASTKCNYQIPVIEIRDLDPAEICYQIGRAEGFLFGDMLLGDNKHVSDSSLFPLTIQFKVEPRLYYEGLIDGVLRAACLTVIHRRSVAQLKKPRPTLNGAIIHCLDILCDLPNLLNLVRKGPLYQVLMGDPHRTPSSYPISDKDMGGILRSWLKRKYLNFEKDNINYRPRYNRVCIFADMSDTEVIGPYLLSTQVVSCLFKERLTRSDLSKLRELCSLSESVREGKEGNLQLLTRVPSVVCKEEIRHACRDLGVTRDYQIPSYKWGKEYVGEIHCFPVEFSVDPVSHSNSLPSLQFRCPLVSGMRLFQMATGAHYKIRTIIVRHGLSFRDFLCGGDGSGGMTAALLRLNHSSRGLYNSLLEFSGSSMRGAKPGPPPAIIGCPGIESRCLNLHTVWDEPSDLSQRQTWEVFHQHKRRHKMTLDLIVLDMEVRDEAITRNIIHQVETEGLRLLDIGGSLIFKTYITSLIGHSQNVLTHLGRYFKEVVLTQTSLSSSRTSEVYVIFCQLMEKKRRDHHVNWVDLWTKVPKAFVYRSEEEELERACAIPMGQILSGVPKELLPDVEVELGTFVNILGVGSGTSGVLAKDFVYNGSMYGPETLWTLIIVCVNMLIDVVGEHLNSWPIPSDTACESVAILLLGTGYWWAQQTKDIILFKVLNSINDTDLSLSFKKRERLRSEVPMKILRWNLEGKGSVHKRIPTRSLQAGIGQCLRLCNRMLSYKRSTDKGLVDSLVRKYNLNFSWAQTARHTGVMNLLIHRQTPVKRGAVALQEPEQTERSWRS